MNGGEATTVNKSNHRSGDNVFYSVLNRDRGVKRSHVWFAAAAFEENGCFLRRRPRVRVRTSPTPCMDCRPPSKGPRRTSGSGFVAGRTAEGTATAVGLNPVLHINVPRREIFHLHRHSCRSWATCGAGARGEERASFHFAQEVNIRFINDFEFVYFEFSFVLNRNKDQMVAVPPLCQFLARFFGASKSPGPSPRSIDNSDAATADADAGRLFQYYFREMAALKGGPTSPNQRCLTIQKCTDNIFPVLNCEYAEPITFFTGSPGFLQSGTVALHFSPLTVLKIRTDVLFRDLNQRWPVIGPEPLSPRPPTANARGRLVRTPPPKRRDPTTRNLHSRTCSSPCAGFRLLFLGVPPIEMG